MGPRRLGLSAGWIIWARKLFSAIYWMRQKANVVEHCFMLQKHWFIKRWQGECSKEDGHNNDFHLKWLQALTFNQGRIILKYNQIWIFWITVLLSVQQYWSQIMEIIIFCPSAREPKCIMRPWTKCIFGINSTRVDKQIRCLYLCVCSLSELIERLSRRRRPLGGPLSSVWRLSEFPSSWLLS